MNWKDRLGGFLKFLWLGNWRAFILGLCFIAGLVVFLGEPLFFKERVGSVQDCPPSSLPSPSPPGPDNEATLVELTPQDRDRLTVPFHSDRMPTTRTLSLLPSTALSVPANQIDVSIETDLVRKDEGTIFPAEQVTFTTRITSNPQRLKVVVCFDPRDVPQGEYTGTLLIGGPGIKPVPVQINLTLAHTAKRMALNLALLGALAGFFVKVLGDQNAAPNFKVYASTLAVGLIAAVTTGYFITYAGNQTFGQDITDWITLFGVGFAAVVTGMTAADALGGRSKTKAQSE